MKNAKNVSLLFILLLFAFSSCTFKDSFNKNDKKDSPALDSTSNQNQSTSKTTATEDTLSSTSEALVNLELANDETINKDNIGNLIFTNYGSDVRYIPLDFAQLTSDSIITVGTTYSVHNLFLVKTDLKGNISKTFNNNTGYSMVQIPGYNIASGSIRVGVMPQSKTIIIFALVYEGEFWLKNSNRATEYPAIITMKLDGSPKPMGNGKNYIVDTNHHVSLLNDFIVDKEDSSWLIFSEFPLASGGSSKTIQCHHTSANYSFNNCTSITENTLNNKVILGNNLPNIFLGNNFPIAETKFWSTKNESTFNEHTLTNELDSEGTPNYATIADSKILLAGCVNLEEDTVRYPKLALWKLDENFNLINEYGEAGRKIFSKEISGCFTNIFNIQNRIIVVAQEGDSQNRHTTISEVDITGENRKVIYENPSSDFLVTSKKIGNDIFILSYNLMSHVSKFIKTTWK